MSALPPDCRLHCGVMDRDHEILFSILGNLESVLRTPDSVASLKAIAVSLEAYIDAHFSNEERLMTDNRYPEMDEHRAAHDEMRTQVRCFRTLVNSGYTETAHDGSVMLRGWIEKHLQAVDFQLAEFLKGRCMQR